MMLAPWFYRNAINPDQGPIVRLSIRELSPAISSDRFEALAYLHPSLQKNFSPTQHEIYGSADGTGSDPRKSIACHKAISEALERWAFYDVLSRPEEHTAYGINIDPTSSGFAAWPGIIAKEARRRARLEAIERWAIRAWWSGLISHEDFSFKTWQGLELLTPFPKSSTVILFGAVAGYHVYGFASAATRILAAHRAETELTRNAHVLQTMPPNLSTAAPIYERRLRFFANLSGQNLFQERIRRSVSIHAEYPKTIVDREIIGPWTKYAKVWRVLFEPKGRSHPEDETFFIF